MAQGEFTSPEHFNIVVPQTAAPAVWGSGNPDSAMGGGSGVSKLDNALACVDDFVTQKLELQDTLETEGRLFGAAPFIYRHGR